MGGVGVVFDRGRNVWRWLGLDLSLRVAWED